MNTIRICLLLLVCGMLATTNLTAQAFKGLALTPPMGWNSWNTFRMDINEQLIRETADAMVSSGMKDAGYTYVVIDDGWASGRDEEGYLIPDPERFPSGIKALADYVHSLGLKLGIYACAGTHTCGGKPGSRGYEYQDARTFARWEVDFVKYDWCHTGTQSAVDSYRTMSDAIRKTGRPMVFSICEWGKNEPWKWGEGIGHMWRTTGDIADSWDGTFPDGSPANGLGWTQILDLQVGLDKYAGPDHWNDPDMLIVGMGNLSPNEYRAHFTMWCMLAAPLMAGNDLRNMDRTTLGILTHKELLEINQDHMGIQAFKVVDEGDLEVWVKDLKGEDLAVCFLNRGDEDYNLTFDWEVVGLRVVYRIRDLWARKNSGNTRSFFEATVPARDVILLRLKK